MENVIYSYKSNKTGAIYTVTPDEYYESSRNWDNYWKLQIYCRYFELNEAENFDIDFTGMTLNEVKKELKGIKIATIVARVYSNYECDCYVDEELTVDHIIGHVRKTRKEYSTNPREAKEYCNITLFDCIEALGGDIYTDNFAISYEEGATLEALEGELKTLTAEYCGDVYMINTIQNGEIVANIGGIYADTELELKQLIIEHLASGESETVEDLEDYIVTKKVLYT